MIVMERMSEKTVEVMISTKYARTIQAKTGKRMNKDEKG
jgi:hypothetical protein